MSKKKNNITKEDEEDRIKHVVNANEAEIDDLLKKRYDAIKDLANKKRSQQTIKAAVREVENDLQAIDNLMQEKLEARFS